MESIPLFDSAAAFASPYGDRARRGADLIPRLLFFVNTEQPTTLIRAANTLSVSARRSPQEKSPWRDLNPSSLAGQTIDAAHVFDVHLGETVAPYTLLEPLRAVLPLSQDRGELVKRADSEGGWYGLEPMSLSERMRRRWRTVNELWDKHKSINNKLSLLERIDYMGNLRAQRPVPSRPVPSRPVPSRPVPSNIYHIRVLYAGSGRPTAAIVTDPDAIIDYTLFWMPTTIEEAHYLLATINSCQLEQSLAPLMPKGQFGARHVQKHLWRLPIPGFDASDALHVEIAEAGQAAASGAQRLWSELSAERQARGKSVSVTVARREIRKWLEESEEGQQVERLVGQLLG